MVHHYEGRRYTTLKEGWQHCGDSLGGDGGGEEGEGATGRRQGQRRAQWLVEGGRTSSVESTFLSSYAEHVALSEPQPQVSAPCGVDGGDTVLHVPQSVQSVPPAQRNTSTSHVPSHAHEHESDAGLPSEVQSTPASSAWTQSCPPIEGATQPLKGHAPRDDSAPEQDTSSSQIGPEPWPK